jgi:hypothetical protein
MKVLYLVKGALEEVGTIRFVDNAVKIDIGDKDHDLFSVIRWQGKEFAPKDGVKYMRVLVEKFRLSNSVVLKREPSDLWMEGEVEGS